MDKDFLLPLNINLDTPLHSLLKNEIISVRLFNALTKSNAFILKEALEFNSSNLYDVKQAGRKTVFELRNLQSRYHSLLRSNHSENDVKTVITSPDFPLYRGDLSFLTDEQFEWVFNHWEMYEVLPASYILYHYLLTSQVRDDIINRLYFSLEGTEKKCTLTDLALRFDLSRERVRQIVLKPLKLPKHLNICRKQILTIFPTDYFCINVADLHSVIEREKLPLSDTQFANLLCCLFNFVTKVSIVPEGNVYVVRRKSLELYPISLLLKQLNTFFKLNPSSSVDQVTQSFLSNMRNKSAFTAFIPIIEEYIVKTLIPLKRNNEISNSKSIPGIDIERSLKIDYDSNNKRNTVQRSSLDEEMPAYKFTDFKRQIEGMYVSSISGQKAPHKPIFLLTLMELIKNGDVKDNQFFFDELLIESFNSNWLKYNNRTVFRPNLSSPFTSLLMDKIWFLKLKANGKIPNNSIKSIKDNVEYGYLDNSFFSLLKETKYHTQMKNFIINLFGLNK